MSMDALLKHKRELHKLTIDADYLRADLLKKLEGKDGFGPTVKEHLKQWNQLLNESFENLKTCYDWVIDLLSTQ